MSHDYTKIRNSLAETYNRYARGREEHIQKSKSVERLDQFIILMKDQDRHTLLDIGAGNGVDSAYFKTKGIAVTAGDLAVEHARLCRNKALPACVTDACNLSFRDQSFDAVWTVQCLFHIPKNLLPTAIEDIHRVLKPNGLFYVSIGGGPDREEIWQDDYFDPPRFFSFHTDESIKKMMTEHFDLISFEEKDVRPEDMHQQTLLLQKAK